MYTNENRQNAYHFIDRVFHVLLPARGMGLRPAQLELSHKMLDAMLGGLITLCDAGTGIGKTYAFLVAGIAYQRYCALSGQPVRPVLISTSSIALQKAILNEYLPFLSKVLLEDKLSTKPLRAVIRKGKGHYVCDERLQARLSKANLEKKNKKALAALKSLQLQLDLDEATSLSGFDREQVCVPQYCTCRRAVCRYRQFQEECQEIRYDFQICNHDLLLADAIHRTRGLRPILPTGAALVLDEAHKLPEIARQMFGVTLRAKDLTDFAHGLHAEHFPLLADQLSRAGKPLVDKLSRPWESHAAFEAFQPLLVAPKRVLPTIQSQAKWALSPEMRNRLETLTKAISILCNGDPDMVAYTTADEGGETMLCATPSDLSKRLRGALWRRSCGMVLTSATLAAGNSFHRFREEVGLATNPRVRESVSPSPFDYQKNCLLYLPQCPPLRRSQDYDSRLADEIAALLEVSHGHALILFTSYGTMSAVGEQLHTKTQCPLFTMSRNALHTVDRFRAAPGSVLLATGPAWEGIDFPGDCVSLLIIPRLPFAFPDALKEKEKENTTKYPALQDFIRAVMVPEMQVKLRQGVWPCYPHRKRHLCRRHPGREGGPGWPLL